MRWLFPFLQWFWVAIVFALIVGAMTNRLFGPITEEAWTFLHTYWASISCALLGISALTLWSGLDKRRHARREATQKQWQEKVHEEQERIQREQRLQQSFALFKPASDLRPEDLEFQPLRPGETIDLRAGFDQRAFYGTYIPRRAIAYDQLTARDEQNVFDEDRLVHKLSQGKGFVLLGQPFDGKTRTLYEIVRQLAGYYVVRPQKGRPTPPDEAFALLKGQHVILLLDDLNSYASRVPDLAEFAEKLGSYAATWTIAATCRDGPELGAVREAFQSSLRRFYEAIPLKLGLLPLTAEGKAQLAHGIGRDWNPQDSEHFPTPGSITMAEALDVMRERFLSLDPEQQDALRGLKLLATAGILPVTHRRLRAIWECIFDRVLHFGDCLDTLGEQSFIRRPPRQDPIQPEPAYLQGTVVYTDGRTPQDDFPRLIPVLEATADVEALFYLGNTYAINLRRPQDAILMYERALALSPVLPGAWYNKGVALGQLGRYPEALQAYEQAVALRPEFPEAWGGMGVVLEKLRRNQEALQAYKRALALRPQFPEAWFNKGGSSRSWGVMRMPWRRMSGRLRCAQNSPRPGITRA